MPIGTEAIRACAAVHGGLRLARSPTVTEQTETLDTTLTIDEVAARYRTSRDTVYRWLKGRNDFPRPIALPSRGLRWTPEQIQRWEQQQVDRVNAPAAA